MCEISAASEQQSGGITEINQAINEMDQMTQQNAACVQETAHAAVQLERQAEQLALQMGIHRMPGAGLETLQESQQQQGAALSLPGTTKAVHNKRDF